MHKHNTADAALTTRVYPALAALPAGYDDVFQSGARSSFFLSRDWFDNFVAKVVLESERVCIYGVETVSGNPVAVLPLFAAREGRGPLSPRTLAGLSNYYTCDFAPVVRQGENAAAVVKALSARLWKDRRDWDVLRLQPLPRDSSLYDVFVRELRNAGMLVQTYFNFGNWYLEVAGRSYQQYVDSLSSVLRKNIPYNLRRLEKRGDVAIAIHLEEEGLDRALEAYEAVYNSSWKIQEATPPFIRGLAHAAARKGWLRLGLIHVGGEPAAAQLWIVHEGIAAIYKIAYDERFAKLSVGTVLTAKLMQHVIDVDKVTVIDYLSGEDDYKKNWMSHRREFWGIVAFNPRSVRGLAQIARHVGGKAGKRAWQKLAARFADRKSR